MNPFIKPIAGAYKKPLIEGLRLLGREKEAELFESGTLKFGVVAGFTGAVRAHKELVAPCIEALKAVPQTIVTGYYIHELESGRVLPAATEGAYVYDPEDKAAAAFAAAGKSDRYYAPGELFFKS
jgi:hypothetical protein